MGIPSKVRIASLEADEVPPEPVVAGVDIREVEPDGVTTFKLAEGPTVSSV